MHYNVLFLFIFFSFSTHAQYDYLYPLFTSMYDTYYPSKTVEEPVAHNEDLTKDRGVYTSRYENEYTALPETHEPDVHVIDVPQLNRYGNPEIVIMEYDD